jgi:hypothetical protein
MLVLARKGLSQRHCGYFGLLVRWQLCLMLYQDLNLRARITETEKKNIKMILKQLAINATETTRPPEGAVVTSAHLTQVLNFLNEMEKKLGAMTSVDGVPQLLQKEVNFVPYPMFDCFVRDDNVERFAGPSDLAPTFRPVELTLIRDTVTTFNELAETLRHADNVSM